jgi:hypothetical protein
MVITENFVISTISDLISCDAYFGGITFDELMDELGNIFIFENDSIDPIKNYNEKKKELTNVINNLKLKYVILTENENMYINTNSDEYIKANKIREEIFTQESINENKKKVSPLRFFTTIKNYLLSYIW